MTNASLKFDDHKGCQGCKDAAKEIRMKDVLMISVKDEKFRSEFKKLKGADSTVAKYEEAGRLWDNKMQLKVHMISNCNYTRNSHNE